MNPLQREFEEKIRAKEAQSHPNGKTGYLSEDQMLADFMTWAKNFHPQLRKAIFHVENEGDNSSEKARMRGAISKAKGKLKGVFDVCCVYRGHMRWFEFKLPGGRWSPEQIELQTLWGGWGIEIVEIRDFDTWKSAIEGILGINQMTITL